MRLRPAAKCAGPGCISCSVSSRRVGERLACRSVRMDTTFDAFVLLTLIIGLATLWIVVFGWPTFLFIFGGLFILSKLL